LNDATPPSLLVLCEELGKKITTVEKLTRHFPLPIES